MITTTLTDFRKEMKQYLDKITDNNETLIINRGKDKGVVMLSMDEYNEYLQLVDEQVELSTTELKSLDEGIQAAKEGKFATDQEVSSVLNRYAEN